MSEPLGRTPRQVGIADHLWDSIQAMSRDMGVDSDGLINQALFAFARQNGYAPQGGAPMPRSEPSSPIPAGFGTIPRPMPAAVAPPVSFAPPAPSMPPKAALIPPPPAAAPAPFVAPPPPAAAHSPFVAPPPQAPAAKVDSMGPLKLNLSSMPNSAPPPSLEPLMSRPANDLPDAPDLSAALEASDLADGVAVPAAEAKSNGVLVLFAEGHELDRVNVPRFLIGRGKHCDLIINSGKVSREHAAIFREGDAYFIEDLGSSNGTWFDKKRITRRQIVDGDEYFICSEKISCKMV